jgi:hypothetical protein
VTLSYLARLACLSLAAFFLAHTVLAAIVSLSARRAIERARQFRPHLAARLLFGLRLLPAAGAGFIVLALCAPSYIALEPANPAEEIGPACLIAALLGAATCLSGIARGLSAAIRSARYLRLCRTGDGPVLLLAGVFRPQLIVSAALRDGLSAGEFEAALRHEEGHGRSRDNLKRLLIAISPDVFPFTQRLRALDTAWQRMAEWAADDFSAAGCRERALSLASALVRVGRMRSAMPVIPLATSLLPEVAELGVRVQRLIEGPPPAQEIPRKLLGPACIALAGLVALAPPMFTVVHRLLEALAH